MCGPDDHPPYADPNPATGQGSFDKEREDALLDTFFPKMPIDSKEASDWMLERAKQEQKVAHELCDADPSLPYITAYIMAGDQLSMERSQRMVEAGIRFERALHFVGSYRRLEFALWALEHGFATKDVVLDELPSLWSGSDPDDTDRRFLELWHDAWLRNKRKPVCDGRPLPARTVRIYRGQDALPDDYVPNPERLPVGIAWSLDVRVAERFANGAALRVHRRPNPVLYVAEVDRKDVYGYLTGRGESEVVVNPFKIRGAPV
jgi:hypothetical protein